MASEPEWTAVADGLHLFGPARIRFWLGNFAPLAKHFAAAMPDDGAPGHAAARRFLDGVALSREDFDALPDEAMSWWLSNMLVAALPSPLDGVVVYSPLPLDGAGRMRAALDALGPVRLVVAPHSLHGSGLESFRAAWPEALFVCPKGGLLSGGVSLRESRPDLAIAAVVGEDEAALAPFVAAGLRFVLLEDGMLNDLAVYHGPCRALLNADFIYKTVAFAAVPGIGGPQRNYLQPEWFASGYQTLNLDASPSALLPDNRAFMARHPRFDSGAFQRSLATVRELDIAWLLSCHTDPVSGDAARAAIEESWGWFAEA